MTNQAIPSQEEPMKPRALTYTEMMNGGSQRMDEAEHAREQELQQRVDDLEKDVAHLEQALYLIGCLIRLHPVIAMD